MLILLLSYFIFIIGFAVYSASGIYHLWRFGYVGDMTKPAVYIYLFLSLLVIVVSLLAISTRDWSLTF